jgi:hypothetical protein
LDDAYARLACRAWAARQDDTVYSHRTVIGLDESSDDLDERRLTRSVLSDDGVSLAGLESEINAVEDLGIAERLPDAGHAQQQS